MEFSQLESTVAVRSLHHRDIRLYALKPYDAVHLAAFDGALALQHQSELDKELSRGCNVINRDADVLHPFDTRVFNRSEPNSGCASCPGERIVLSNTIEADFEMRSRHSFKFENNSDELRSTIRFEMD